MFSTVNVLHAVCVVRIETQPISNDHSVLHPSIETFQPKHGNISRRRRRQRVNGGEGTSTSARKIARAVEAGLGLLRYGKTGLNLLRVSAASTVLFGALRADINNDRSV